MALYKVMKRNGSVVNFDRYKIENALKKAIISVNKTHTNEDIHQLTDEIIQHLEESDSIPNVEQIQDAVEQVLIAHN